MDNANEEELVAIWDVHCKGQMNLITFMDKIHLIHAYDIYQMIDPLVDECYGYYMSIDGPKPILWLLDKLGDLIFKLDKQGPIRKEKWDNMCRRMNM